MKFQQPFISFLLLVSALMPAQAADWHIDPAGSADPNGSAENPFSTIQEGLDHARSGDRIILNPGVYSGPGNYNLDPNGRILTIQGTDPENLEVIKQTIIDPNYQGRGFIFQNGEDPNFLLTGFTVRRTWCEQEDDPPHGSAVFCSGAGLTIRSCIFQDCDADGGWGGVLFGESCDVKIEHGLLVGNKARYGGAIAAIQGSRITLDHCTIAGNQALFFGGGLICDFQTSIDMTNSILTLNRITEAPQNKGWQASVRNSSWRVMYSNISNEPNDLEIVGTSLVIFEEGVIHTNSGFAFADPSLPSSDWDLHLRSRRGRWDSETAAWITDSETSLCIDAGDPDTTWTAEPWPNGKRANMGFYGNTPQASMNGNPADFDVNGTVDLEDFSELAERWLGDGFSGIYDLSGDGRLDLFDFERLSAEWLWSHEEP